MRLYINLPSFELKEAPIKAYYRYVMSPQPKFDESGRYVYFSLLTVEATMFISVIDERLVCTHSLCGHVVALRYRRVDTPSAVFKQLPEDTLMTLHLKTPHAWLTEACILLCFAVSQCHNAACVCSVCECCLYLCPPTPPYRLLKPTTTWTTYYCAI